MCELNVLHVYRVLERRCIFYVSFICTVSFYLISVVEDQPVAEGTINADEDIENSVNHEGRDGVSLTLYEYLFGVLISRTYK